MYFYSNSSFEKGTLGSAEEIVRNAFVELIAYPVIQ